MSEAPLPCFCLTGPTACGKTELALRLAAHVPLEIISMDSAMVYRGMDVGTAKPPLEVRARVPHHLIDIAEPFEAYSAGRFCRDARLAIAAARARGRLPLLVGGTLLYLRALNNGLSVLPAGDPAVRRELDREAARDGWPALHARLEAVDPEAAGRIAATDRQRIQRALEVYRLTHEPMSALQRRPGRGGAGIVTIALVPADRRELAARIERRFDRMVEAGFVEEVRRLRARGDLTAETPAMRAIGYRQVWAYLDGRRDWTETRRRALAATRQLAKRQMTWLRGDPAATAVPAFASEALATLLEAVKKSPHRAG